MPRAYFFSLFGHIILAGLIFFLPDSRPKIYIDEVPRSVRLVASLDPAPAKKAPTPAPKVKPPPPPPPKPQVKTRPKPVSPARPLPSTIEIPVKKVAPLVKPRELAPPPSSFDRRLKEKLGSMETETAATAPELAESALPAAEKPLTAPELAPVQPPSISGRIAPLSDFPYSWYLKIIKDTIFNRWSPPSDFYLGRRQTVAVVSFRIGLQGKLSRITMTESSGFRLFDQSVLNAMNSMAALPPLPADYKEDFLDVVIHFQSQNQ